MLDELWIVVTPIPSLTKLEYLRPATTVIHNAEVRRHNQNAVQGLDNCLKKKIL